MQRWLVLCSLIAACSLCGMTSVAVAQREIVVQKKDTLWSLAKKYDVLPEDIVKANRLSNPDALQPGMRLRIPPPVKPRIVPATMRKTAVINGDRVCIRYAPNRTDRSITLVDKGHPVVVTARRGNWLQVKLPSGQVGWVRDDLVRVTGTLAAKSEPAPRKRQVVRRPTPTKTAMKPPSPRRHTPRPVAVTANASTTGESIVQTASRFKGVRYRWGGSSRSGFDCSGFTRYVYRHKMGIELPHSASAQFRRGTPVSRENLQPGDLVFFQTYRRGPSHVGIYIGNGKFIHASSARGRVRVDSLNEGYYRQRYLGARRIIRAKNEGKTAQNSLETSRTSEETTRIKEETTE